MLGECLKQVIYRKNKQKYLANHVMETKQTDSEFQCSLHCARHGSCTSVDYKTSGIGKGRCEVKKRTRQETADDNEKTSHEFNHLFVIKQVHE